VQHPLRTTLRDHPKAWAGLSHDSVVDAGYYTYFSALTPFRVDEQHAAAQDVFLAAVHRHGAVCRTPVPLGALADRSP